ncbi:PIN domain-containing protein [Nostoc sp.]|uniref:PIN domain-containing protein n=1 Tax=Nostoc sp. TaxID=1180 RepID=UPI002FF60137
MDLDELKNIVRAGQFRAITLDTSIFDAQGLRLESGLLKQLEQFRHSSTRLILSEVVKEEVLSHLIEKARDAQKEIEKSLKQAKEHWQVDDKEIEVIKKTIFGQHEAQEIASKRFSQFVEVTSLEIVEAQDYVMVGDLIQKYFQAKPPFSETGKKKSEFPDAIALMSLETWANKNKTKIIVVTSDNDWKNFCKGSERLIAIDDFAGALVLCQLPDAVDICRNLSERYEKGELEDVKEAISNALEYRISDIDIYPEANSAYVYEHESTEITFNEFEFKLLEPPNLIFRPVKFDDESLVVESKLSVDVNVECSFSFSVYDSIDRDDVPMGNSSASIQTNLDVDILVSFIGDLDKVGAEFEVEDVEIEITVPDVDFGMIEPDWMDEEDYDY